MARRIVWTVLAICLVLFPVCSAMSAKRQAGQPGSLVVDPIRYQYAHFTFNFGFPGLPPIDFPGDTSITYPSGSAADAYTKAVAPDTPVRPGGTIRVVADPHGVSYTVPDRTGNSAHAIVGSLTNQYVVMDRTSTSVPLEMIRDFRTPDIINSGLASVEARVQVPDNNQAVRELLLYADKTTPIAGVLIGHGKITSLNNDVLLSSVPVGTWIDMKIVLNITTKIYEVFINGDRKAANLPWSNNASAPQAFSRLLFRCSGPSAGKLYIDDILIKTDHKVNVQTAGGVNISGVQQGRTAPSAYQVSLPASYNPDRTYPVIMHVVTGNNNYANELITLRNDPNMIPFIIVAVHVIHGNNLMMSHSPTWTGSEFPYNEGLPKGDVWGVEWTWYADKITAYNKAAIRPGDTTPWSGASPRVSANFDEQVVIETFLQIKEDYNTEGKFYMDGFQAAGNALFPVVMYHPEYIKAFFGHEPRWGGIGGPNWDGTGMDAWNLAAGMTKPVSKSPERVHLPIRLAVSSVDKISMDDIFNIYSTEKEGVPLPEKQQLLYARANARQVMRAKLAMEANGFKNVELIWMPNGGNRWVAEAMAFFKEVYNNGGINDARKAI